MNASGESRYNKCSGLSVSFGSGREEVDGAGDSGGAVSGAGDANGLSGCAEGERGKTLVLTKVASDEKKDGGKAEYACACSSSARGWLGSEVTGRPT